MRATVQDQLKQICSEILGEALYTAMKAGMVSKTKILDMAIRQAFVYGCTDEQAVVLKTIALKLDKDGSF